MKYAVFLPYITCFLLHFVTIITFTSFLVAELYDSFYNGYGEIMHIADNIKNMQSEYTNTMDYIKSRYGDSSFWQQCELTKCNPEVYQQQAKKHAAQSQLALTASRQEQESALGVNAATKKEIAKLLGEMRKNESKLSQAGDEGVASTLQLMGKINAKCGQLLALNTSVMQQFSAAQAAENMAKAADAQAKQEKEDEQFKKMLAGFKADGVKTAPNHKTRGAGAASN